MLPATTPLDQPGPGGSTGPLDLPGGPYAGAMRFVTWLMTYAAGLMVAAWLLPGIWFEGPDTGAAEFQEKLLPLMGVAIILGLISTVIEPIVKLISLPFIILTLGLLLFVINALMLMLTAAVANEFDLGFHVNGFWNALVGAIVITVAGWGARALMSSDDRR